MSVNKIMGMIKALHLWLADNGNFCLTAFAGLIIRKRPYLIKMIFSRIGVPHRIRP